MHDTKMVKVDADDPKVEHYRRGSTLHIEIEVVHDHDVDATDLAEDVASLAEQELERRGVDVWGHTLSVKDQPLYLPSDEAKALGVV